MLEFSRRTINIHLMMKVKSSMGNFNYSNTTAIILECSVQIRNSFISFKLDDHPVKWDYHPNSQIKISRFREFRRLAQGHKEKWWSQDLNLILSKL